MPVFLSLAYPHLSHTGGCIQWVREAGSGRQVQLCEPGSPLLTDLPVTCTRSESQSQELPSGVYATLPESQVGSVLGVTVATEPVFSLIVTRVPPSHNTTTRFERNMLKQHRENRS